MATHLSFSLLLDITTRHSNDTAGIVFNLFNESTSQRTDKEVNHYGRQYK